MELNEKSEDHQSNYSSARGGLKRLHQNSIHHVEVEAYFEKP